MVLSNGAFWGDPDQGATNVADMDSFPSEDLCHVVWEADRPDAVLCAFLGCDPPDPMMSGRLDQMPSVPGQLHYTSQIPDHRPLLMHSSSASTNGAQDYDLRAVDRCFKDNPAMAKSPTTQSSRQSSCHYRKSSKDVEEEEGRQMYPPRTHQQTDDEMSSNASNQSNAPPAKRRAHYLVEKRYRASLHEKFEALRLSLLDMSDSVSGPEAGGGAGEAAQMSKMNKSEVLTRAVAYIQMLQEQNMFKEVELESLRNRIRISMSALEDFEKV